MPLGATGKIIKVSLTQAGAGTLLIQAAVAGYVLRLLALNGSLTANGTIQIQSIGSVATNKTGPVTCNQGTATPFSDLAEEGYASSNSGEGLQIVTTGGGFNGSAVLQQILP